MKDLTSVEHWDATWAGSIRYRLPSSLIVSTRNLQRLLRQHVKPGDRVLEIGCAPGKILAWVAAACQAEVSGLDYSPRGFDLARELFAALELRADLRREDLRQTTFSAASFDVIYSVGVIEHFDDPRGVVQDHLNLVKPGGTALITVPNYRGIYGTLQGYFDAESLDYHNLNIMTSEALAELVSPDLGARVRAYPMGRLSPWQLSIAKRWPSPVAQGVSLLANAAALAQPVDIRALCPILVLEVVKPANGTDVSSRAAPE